MINNVNKKYGTNLITKFLYFIFILFILFNLSIDVTKQNFNLIFFEIIFLIILIISMPLLFKYTVFVDNESVSIVPLFKLRNYSIKYQDIKEVILDEFLDLFSVVYLFPKEKKWRKGITIHSSTECYKDCIREILSHLSSTTYVDPEVYKFLDRPSVWRTKKIWILFVLLLILGAIPAFNLLKIFRK